MMRLICLLTACLLLAGCGVQGSLTLPDKPAPAKKKASGAAQVLPNGKKKTAAPDPIYQDEDEPAVFQEDNFFTEDADGNYDIRGNSSGFE